MFMHAMPHVEIRTNADGKEEFKIPPPDPDAPPCVMTLRVQSRADLWRVLFKSPDGCIQIKHMEFEIGADSKRMIDTLYNHISTAVWNLSAHLRGNASVFSSPGLSAGAFLRSPYAVGAEPDVQLTLHPWDKYGRTWKDRFGRQFSFDHAR